MGDRRARLRIDSVRVALAIALEIIAIVAGSGNAEAIQIEHFLRNLLIIARRLTELGVKPAPAELPIGVVTAFVGAPFFILLLRTREVAR